ncbi:MAG: hypothetical protein ACT4QD_25335 [Acidobacteriota bacterium]
MAVRRHIDGSIPLGITNHPAAVPVGAPSFDTISAGYHIGVRRRTSRSREPQIAMMLHLDKKDPTSKAVVHAIQTGDVPTLERLLAEHSDLATAHIEHNDRCGAQSRTLLHIATDWPGHYPNGPAVVAVPRRTK